MLREAAALKNQLNLLSPQLPLLALTAAANRSGAKRRYPLRDATRDEEEEEEEEKGERENFWAVFFGLGRGRESGRKQGFGRSTSQMVLSGGRGWKWAVSE